MPRVQVLVMADLIVGQASASFLSSSFVFFVAGACLGAQFTIHLLSKSE